MGLEPTITSRSEVCKKLGESGSVELRRRHDAEVHMLKALRGQAGFPSYRSDRFSRSGERFVVYQGVPGRTLRASGVTEGGNVAGEYPDVEWRLFVRQLLLRVRFLHECRSPILHGDISAGNVIVSSTGEVGLVDFGVARSRCLPWALRFPSRQSVAAPRYMSPEQAQGRFWGRASDIYQVGLVTLELLRREPPGLGVETPALLARLRTDPGHAQRIARDQSGLAGRFLPHLLDPDPRCRPGARAALDLLERLPGI